MNRLLAVCVGIVLCSFSTSVHAGTPGTLFQWFGLGFGPGYHGRCQDCSHGRLPYHADGPLEGHYFDQQPANSWHPVIPTAPMQVQPAEADWDGSQHEPAANGHQTLLPQTNGDPRPQNRAGQQDNQPYQVGIPQLRLQPAGGFYTPPASARPRPIVHPQDRQTYRPGQPSFSQFPVR